MLNIQRLTDDISYGHSGIQRRIRILKYHCCLFPEFPDLLSGSYLFTLEINLSGCRPVQMKYGTSRRGFTAAGFSDEA